MGTPLRCIAGSRKGPIDLCDRHESLIQELLKLSPGGVLEVGHGEVRESIADERNEISSKVPVAHDVVQSEPGAERDRALGSTGIEARICIRTVCRGGEDFGLSDEAWELSDVLVLHIGFDVMFDQCCLLYTSPSPRDATLSRMPSSA